MKNAEEQQEGSTTLNDSVICNYLLRHPYFFIRNAQLAEQLQVPHPVRGSVSLVEWHMARARKRIEQLEADMHILMEQATLNHALFSRLLTLQEILGAAENLEDMLARLHRWAKDLGLSGAYLRLFPEYWHIGAPSSFTHLALNRQAFEPLRVQRFGDARHYLGTLHGPELLVALPQAKAVGSVAMSLMGNRGELGVLIFTSRDPLHYQHGQGTQLLHELAQLLPEQLERWIERRRP
ncbi:DUF484 domain-containing protein [Apirhabdus apintestini]|nr:DUF484 domain-containing protein [Enterobacteriaceae bacterium CA-0114]